MSVSVGRFSWGWMWLAALFMSACAGKQELVSGLNQNDANEILVVLNSQNIAAEKMSVPGRTVTFSISVPAKSSQQALKLLVDNHLPRQPSAGLSEVYPAGSAGLIPTRSEERARYLMALQGEVENMIKILPGVVSAKVVVVRPEPDAIKEIGSPDKESTASVAVVYNPVSRNNKPVLNPSEIKELVASAVEDLKPNNVSVVLTVNSPLRIITSAEINGKKGLSGNIATFEGANSQGAVETTGSSALPSAAVNSDVHKEELEGLHAQVTVLKNDLLAEQHRYKMRLLLYLALAALGLILGVVGIVRSILLKGKMGKLEQTKKGLPTPASQPAGSISEAAPPSPPQSSPKNEG